MKSNKTKKYMHDCSTNMAWLYNLLLFAWTFASVAIVISTSCTPFSMILPRCHKCVFFGNSVAFWIAKLLSKVEIRAESNVKWRVEVDIHNSTKYTYRSVLGKVYFLGNYVGNLRLNCCSLTYLRTHTLECPFRCWDCSDFNLVNELAPDPGWKGHDDLHRVPSLARPNTLGLQGLFFWLLKAHPGPSFQPHINTLVKPWWPLKISFFYILIMNSYLLTSKRLLEGTFPSRKFCN